MATLPRPLNHPGAILREIIAAMKLSQGEFAAQADISSHKLWHILEGIGVDAITSEKLEIATGLKAHIWLSLQDRYAAERKSKKGTEEIASTGSDAIADSRRVPLAHLRKMIALLTTDAAGGGAFKGYVSTKCTEFPTPATGLPKRALGAAMTVLFKTDARTIVDRLALRIAGQYIEALYGQEQLAETYRAAIGTGSARERRARVLDKWWHGCPMLNVAEPEGEDVVDDACQPDWSRGN